MMEVKCKPAKYAESHFRDMSAVSTLESILAIHKKVVPRLSKNDTHPNNDGVLSVLGKDGIEIGIIIAQVKALKIKGNKVSYYVKERDKKFLAYCKEPRANSVLFIVVDTENSVAYWEKIDAEYIKKIKGKTISFSMEKIIAQDRDDYHKYWINICKKDQADARQEQNEDKSDKLKEAGKTFDGKIFPSRTLSEVKLQLQSLFVDQGLKYKYYYPFLDLLEPYNLGARGKKTREKVRELFDISEKDEKDFFEKMKSEKLIKIVGEFCFPINKKLAENLQNEMLNKSAIDLDTIINLFVLENE